jgi:hypothetical protein
MTKNYSREQVLEAIKESGGIMSTVASELECDWHTAKRYVNMWVSTAQAFEAEGKAMIDMAEGVLFRNIQLAALRQKAGEMVDTKDVRYVLSTKGKDRGYTDKTEVDQDVTLHFVYEDEEE